MPEALLIVGLLLLLSLLAFSWQPLLGALPVAFAILAVEVVQAFCSAVRARFTSARDGGRWLALCALTAGLHLVQPIARLKGRLDHGLTPWRRRGTQRLAAPWWRKRSVWRQRWQSSETTLESLHAALGRAGAVAWRGGDFDAWDLAVRGGLCGTARLKLAVEDHGANRQMLRFRMAPRVPHVAVVLLLALAGVSGLALADGAMVAATVLATVALALAGGMALDCALAQGALAAILDDLEQAG